MSTTILQPQVKDQAQNFPPGAVVKKDEYISSSNRVIGSEAMNNAIDSIPPELWIIVVDQVCCMNFLALLHVT